MGAAISASYEVGSEDKNRQFWDASCPATVANEGLGWDPLLKGTTPLHDFRTKHICAFLPMEIADMCTRENSQTIGIAMDIFPSPSMLETRHFIFPCEGHHCVFWGLSSSRQSCISDILGNRLVCMIFASLRMLQVTQGRYYMFSRVRRACCGVGWLGGWVGM